MYGAIWVDVPDIFDVQPAGPTVPPVPPPEKSPQERALDDFIMRRKIAKAMPVYDIKELAKEIAAERRATDLDRAMRKG